MSAALPPPITDWVPRLPLLLLHLPCCSLCLLNAHSPRWAGPACVGSLWAKPVASASPGGTRWTHRPGEGEAGELQMGGFPLLVSVWVLCPCVE